MHGDHKPSSISAEPGPPGPRLRFWLRLCASRRSPDTHHWVSLLHINATRSPIKSPACPGPPKGESFHSCVCVCPSGVCVLFDIRCVVCACALFSATFTLTHRPPKHIPADSPGSVFKKGVSFHSRARFSVHCWPVFKALAAKNKHPEFK